MLLQSPLNGQIYQRDQSNRAIVPIVGLCATAPERVACRFVPIRPGQGNATDWQTLSLSGNQFSGDVIVSAGWYKLELYTTTSDVLPTTRVGIGECFVVAGHSVAAGDAQSMEGATDERVQTTPRLTGAAQEHYAQSGNVDELKPLSFVAYASGVSPGPFGANTHFWAKFAELIAQRENVPVYVLNAAFGGTTLEHWAKSAQGLPFVHSFVNSSAGMPYANLRNALTKYLSQTGCRAILSDQGQNDYPRTDEEAIFDDYRMWINHARLDGNAYALPVVVNRQTPFHTADHIRRVQERVISQVDNCFAGPDYDAGLVDQTDRYDHIHLNVTGQRKAAQLWADAVSSSFLKQSTPYVPRSLPESTSGPAMVATPFANPSLVTKASLLNSRLTTTANGSPNGSDGVYKAIVAAIGLYLFIVLLSFTFKHTSNALLNSQ